MKVTLDSALEFKRSEHVTSNWSEAQALLDSLFARPDGTVYFWSDAEREYLVIGNEAGVALAHVVNDAHALWAVNTDDASESFVEFNFGNTLTAIPKRYCISRFVACQIAEHYFSGRGLLSSVPWEDEWA